jgi:DNA-binding NarL/FixJ family response regulator
MEMVVDLYLSSKTPPPGIVVQGRLTAREREILQLLAEGDSSKDVAATLALSTKTVETHRSNIMRKLNCHSVSQLTLYAIRNNLACLPATMAATSLKDAALNESGQNASSTSDVTRL